jgi:AraC-like DNA-binding protein
MRCLHVFDLGYHGLDIQTPGVRQTVFRGPWRSSPQRCGGNDLHYVVRGMLRLDNGREKIEAGPGTAVFRCIGDCAGLEIDAGSTLLHCHFAPGVPASDVVTRHLDAWVDTAFRAEAATRRRDCCLLIPDTIALRRRETAEDLLQGMSEERDASRSARLLARKARLLLFLQLVSEDVVAELTQRSPAQAAGDASRPVQRALAYIETRLARPLSLRDVAHSLRLNPAYLGRIFRRALGESVGNHILRRRLCVAKNLLATSSLSIKEVAAAVGFRDPLYFSRMFRREEGHSPREYARGQRQTCVG